MKEEFKRLLHWVRNCPAEAAERINELKQQNEQLKKEVEQYEKSIKECIERMNEGGQGTRSFIYEKLREVMEGTECMGK
jgi:FtsZ-binding cell division protein ZapB